MASGDDDAVIEWKVLLCADCERGFGRSSRAKDLSCPHCGCSAPPHLLSRHLNPADAQQAIALANIPLEIRAELTKSMSNSRHKEQKSKRINADDLPVILRAAADENGELDVDSLQVQLSIAGIVMDGEVFADEAAVAGILLNIGAGRWRILD
jgi:hypothetical protein